MNAENKKAEPALTPEQWDRMLAENRELREKLEFFQSRFEEMEQENQGFLHSWMEAQSQYDNLVNLHVASCQLFSTLSAPAAVQVIGEIVTNMIGVEEYFVCLIDPRSGFPVIISGKGLNGNFTQQKLSKPDPVLLRVIREKRSYHRGEDESSPYLACIPLKNREEVAGVICIRKLMDQKKGKLSILDQELLDLLAEHAAPAIMHSQAGDQAETIRRVIENFLGHKEPGPPRGG